MRHSAILQTTVLVEADFSLISGRDFFLGVMRYARMQPTWNLRIIQSPDKLTVDAMRSATSAKLGLITCTLGSPKFQHELARRNIPCVFAGTHAEGCISRLHRCCRVRLDEEAIGRCAARHFTGIGNFATLGCVTASSAFLGRCHRLRQQGFEAELGTHGKSCVSFSKGNLSKWLAALDKPAAIFAVDDSVAVSVLEACRSADESVPECVSILGVDNDELLCNAQRPTLSSIMTGCEDEGFRCARELDRLMRHGNRRADGEEVVVATPVKVIVRQSTCTPAPATVLIRRADEYIRAHLASRLRVKDVADAMGVSRRLLELRFRQFKKTSIHRHIGELRLKAVARLLRSAPTSICRLAAEYGFSDARHLRRAFKARFRVSPGEYRQRQAPPRSAGDDRA